MGEAIKGISASKKMTFSVVYVAVATALLVMGYLESGDWVSSTSIVTGALLAAQAYQDRASFMKQGGKR